MAKRSNISDYSVMTMCVCAINEKTISLNLKYLGTNITSNSYILVLE